MTYSTRWHQSQSDITPRDSFSGYSIARASAKVDGNFDNRFAVIVNTTGGGSN